MSHQDCAVLAEEQECLVVQGRNGVVDVTKVGQFHARDDDAGEFVRAAQPLREEKERDAGDPARDRGADVEAGIGMRPQEAEEIAVRNIELPVRPAARGADEMSIVVGDGDDNRLGEPSHAVFEKLMGFLAAQPAIERLGAGGTARRRARLQLRQREVDRLDRARGLLGQDGGDVAGVVRRLVDGIGSEAQDGQADRRHRHGNEAGRDPDQAVDGPSMALHRHCQTGRDAADRSRSGCCPVRA